ncbi:signal recognition particle protein [Rickettsiales endosymbiont of Peranema trichophorum]|uniref:signal recognition particle protein n=1 Tax=Rickettsiales endosymbiont of Peranema trichophorum TaxID=2486577 RepID=UPI00102310E2|nr:signal recognition particle protein [Rickettsiales endosymbiont of Peranema trichophorum]RZI46352.1 signal recognition particle protein [Rickettsiales endosymbiont of Peranema trichophorum]
MFSLLSDSLSKLFQKLKSKGVLTEKDIDDAMREIRLALLEADVALPVVKELIANVKTKAIGQEIVKSVAPAQMVVKIVNDELVNILKSDDQSINVGGQAPVVIMLVGLQGAGKTTTAVKLGAFLRKKLKKKVLLASLDVYRPAAIEQLQILGKQVEIDTFESDKNLPALEIAKSVLLESKQKGYEVLILDTAGKLHTDPVAINELQQIKKMAAPLETFLVVDALTGQDAANIGKVFNEQLGITGIILTRVDGDAKGGAALSLKMITGAPIKLLGVGEKISELEEFHPERAVSRILGMGDIVSLVEKASSLVNEEDALTMTQKMRQGRFDLNDLKRHLKNMKKMGGIASLLSMLPKLPGMSLPTEGAVGDDAFKRIEAIIDSMTELERQEPKILNASRKIRVAKGSGTSVQDINRLLKQHLAMSDMMKRFSKMDPRRLKDMLK